MAGRDQYIPNHNFDAGPSYDPIYYEGEEIEKANLAFTKQPLHTSIDNYFDYTTPVIIRNTADAKALAKETEAAKKRIQAYGNPIVPKPVVTTTASTKNVRSAPKRQNQRPQSGANISQGRQHGSPQESTWNNDTKTPGLFDDRLKKKEIFTYRRGQPESQNDTAQKIIQGIVAYQDHSRPEVPRPVTHENPPKPGDICYTDVADIEKMLSKQNALTVKSIIKTNEAKLKILEDQLRKEKQINENRNKDYFDKMNQLVSEHQYSEDFVRGMKQQNDIALKQHGFNVSPAKPVTYFNQKKSEMHEIAAPKVKSSNYGVQPRKKSKSRSNSRSKSAGKTRPANSILAKHRTPSPSRYDTMEFRTAVAMPPEEEKRLGITWADQMDLLKEGYQNQVIPKSKIKNIVQMQKSRSKSPSGRNSTRDHLDVAKQGTFMSSKGLHNPYPLQDSLRNSNNPSLRQSYRSQEKLRPGKIAPTKIQFDHHIQNLHEFEGDNYPQMTKNAHMADIGRLENQLSQIRQNLKPIISQINKGTKNQGPNADLVAASVGRMIKIHSEKLTNMVIDDLLVEIIAILNQKEEMEHRQGRDRDLKDMALALCEELNKIDVDQRFLFESAVNRPLNSQTMRPNPYGRTEHSALLNNSRPMPALNSNNFAMNFIHPNDTSAPRYQTTDSHLPNREFDQRSLNKLNLFTNALLGKGPYKGPFPTSSESLALDPSLLMDTLRNQILNEDAVNTVPYLRKQNVQATCIDLDALIDECLRQVLKEVEEAQEEFVKNVVKEEFS